MGIQTQNKLFRIPIICVGVMLLWCPFATRPSRADTGVVYKEARPMKALAGDRAEKTQPANVAEEVTQPPKAGIPVKKKADSDERLVKLGDEEGEPDKKGKADKEEEYTYDPRGKVDPFVPFILTADKSFSYSGGAAGENAAEVLKKLREAKTELQTIKLSELTLTAIIKAGDKVWAMVSGPGGRGYILKKGTYVGTEGGVVEQVVYQDKKTAFGVESVRKVIIKEPYVDPNGELAYRLVEKTMSLPDNTATK